MSAIPIEVKLFVIMFVLLGGILWLMKVWGDFVTRREARTMSSASLASVQTGPRPAPPPVLPPEPPPVPWQQYHIGAAQSVDFGAVLRFISETDITDEQAIALFAAAHRAPSDYFLSANKIRDGVGGSRDEVLSQVAALRPRPPAKKIEAHLDRPVKGW